MCIDTLHKGDNDDDDDDDNNNSTRTTAIAISYRIDIVTEYLYINQS
jgi:hypothetical protein